MLPRFFFHFWSANFCRIFNIRVSVDDQDFKPRSSLILCNHMAMIDILVLLSTFNILFVSKKSVIYWPVIGQLAWLMGMIFIDRSSGRSLLKSILKAEKALEKGNNILVFPEGTVGDGRSIEQLKSPFLRLTEDGFNTQPIYMHYLRVNGRLANPDIYPYLFFTKKVSFIRHAIFLLSTSSIECEINCLEPLDTSLSRKENSDKLTAEYRAIMDQKS